MKKNLDITKPRYSEQILSIEVPLYKKVIVSAVCIFSLFDFSVSDPIGLRHVICLIAI